MVKALRPVTESFLVFVGDPSGLVAAHVREILELAIEPNSVRAFGRLPHATRGELDQLAILVDDLALRLRFETARGTNCELWRLQKRALGALLRQCLRALRFCFLALAVV